MRIETETEADRFAKCITEHSVEMNPSSELKEFVLKVSEVGLEDCHYIANSIHGLSCFHVS